MGLGLGSPAQGAYRAHLVCGPAVVTDAFAALASLEGAAALVGLALSDLSKFC